MRTLRVGVASLVSLASGMCAASCIQSTEPPLSETSAAVALPVEDEQVGEAMSALSLPECVVACEGGADTMAVFCRAIPNPAVRAGCWGVALVGGIACTNWCYWHFST